ncbi:MAG: 4Fe-4S ferredoxin, partial [Deltaproteobacteria bacterium]|nr:4Fe-4S ferredoxin [Deltaproteobacteria bacterium]
MMKIITINKQDWARGLERVYDAYRLFGPVKQDEFHNFRELVKGELPDLNLLNTRLSAKSMVYPQSEKLFEFTLDENRDDHHMLKEIHKDYS